LRAAAADAGRLSGGSLSLVADLRIESRQGRDSRLVACQDSQEHQRSARLSAGQKGPRRLAGVPAAARCVPKGGVRGTRAAAAAVARPRPPRGSARASAARAAAGVTAPVGGFGLARRGADDFQETLSADPRARAATVSGFHQVATAQEPGHELRGRAAEHRQGQLAKALSQPQRNEGSERA